MKKFIVYYPFSIGEATSGSTVRPVKMLEMFRQYAKDHQFECLFISGEAHERKAQLKEVYQKTNPKDILFCYMENQTTPIWLTDRNHLPKHPFVDLAFLNFLKRHEIPLGIFYRDIYWKFSDLYKVKNPVVKNALIQLFKLEHSMFNRYSKTIFLPSLEMNHYAEFPQEKVVASPPGGMDWIDAGKRKEDVTRNPKTAIYVGGISPRYGIRNFLEGLNQVNHDQTLFHLILVCRAHEFKAQHEMLQPYLDKPWLSIHHAHGDQLISLYEKADLGIVTLQKTTYNDFAVPVKLFEYLSYGLPVLATDCEALKTVVSEDQLGIVVQEDPESIKEGLMKLSDWETLTKYRKNTQKALKEKHKWYNRVESVVQSLVD